MTTPSRPSARAQRPAPAARLAIGLTSLALVGATVAGPAGASSATAAPVASFGAAASPAAVATATTAATAAPAVSAKPSTTVARPGARVSVTGQLKSAQPKTAVSLQRLHGRSWRTVASVTPPGTSAAARAYTLRVPTSAKGRTVFRVASVSNGGQRVGTSRPFTMLVGAGNPKSVGYLTTPPARWNPCSPVRYRVNLEGAPKGAAADIDAAIGQIAAGTGMRFVKVGTTGVVPGSKGQDVPDTYPKGTDLVVAFARPGDTRPAKRSAYLTKGSDIVGVGGAFFEPTPQRVGSGSWHRIVQGYVVLDNTKKLPTGFGRGNSTGLLGTWGQVLMHELGHVVGLDHPTVSDPIQIMYPATTSKPAVWGAGDLVGLQRLGTASGCFPAARAATKSAAMSTDKVLPLDRPDH